MQETEVHQLLVELEALLSTQGEQNWIRGIIAAREALEQPGGLETARSIYKTICRGNCSFSDYYFHHDDFDTRVELNAPLGHLRKRLWAALEA